MAEDITGEAIPHNKDHKSKAAEAAAPLVDEVLDAMDVASTGSHSDDTDVSEQLAAMQTEVHRIRESMTLIGDGAKNIVQTKVRTVTEDLEDRIRLHPIPSVFIAAFAGYLFGVIRRR